MHHDLVDRYSKYTSMLAHRRVNCESEKCLSLVRILSARDLYPHTRKGQQSPNRFTTCRLGPIAVLEYIHELGILNGQGEVLPYLLFVGAGAGAVKLEDRLSIDANWNKGSAADRWLSRHTATAGGKIEMSGREHTGRLCSGDVCMMPPHWVSCSGR